MLRSRSQLTILRHFLYTWIAGSNAFPSLVYFCKRCVMSDTLIIAETVCTPMLITYRVTLENLNKYGPWVLLFCVILRRVYWIRKCLTFQRFLIPLSPSSWWQMLLEPFETCQFIQYCRYIPQDNHLHIYFRENLTSQIEIIQITRKVTLQR